MDAVFEFLAGAFFEVFGEIFVEFFYKMMTLFGKNYKKIKKAKLRNIIILEMITLFLLFVFALLLSLASGWTNIWGKIILFISVAVPIMQIILGLIMKIIKKFKL